MTTPSSTRPQPRTDAGASARAEARVGASCDPGASPSRRPRLLPPSLVAAPRARGQSRARLLPPGLAAAPLLLLASALLLPGILLANGGTLRLANVPMGEYRVSAFTDPTPVRPDSLDVSLLIVHARTGEVVDGLDVRVRTRLLEPRHGGHAAGENAAEGHGANGHGAADPGAAPRPGAGEERRATREEADDPRYYATKFGLGAEGRWELTVVVEGPQGSGEASFEVTARELGLFGNPLVLVLLALFPLLVVGGWLARGGGGDADGEGAGGETVPEGTPAR